MARNVLGGELVACSYDPLTGFFRDGCCNTQFDDVGTHVICAKVTAEFLTFSKQRGNDLGTPGRKPAFAACDPAIAGACACCAGRKPSTRAWRHPSCCRARTNVHWNLSLWRRFRPMRCKR